MLTSKPICCGKLSDDEPRKNNKQVDRSHLVYDNILIAHKPSMTIVNYPQRNAFRLSTHCVT